MKQLIKLFLLAPLSLSLLNANSSYAGSISFRPVGTQLDGDEILDIEPNNNISFDVFLNTQEVTGSIVNLSYIVSYDLTELRFRNLQNTSLQIGAPQVIDGQTNSRQFTISQSGTPGIGPGQIGIALSRISFDVLKLVNDGVSDFSIGLLGARNNLDQVVVNQFNLRTQTVEVQPVPEPITILGSGTALVLGALLKRKFSKKQKNIAVQ
ncbi:PEP-CTERM sorting domain-containing protein [Nostoc sp. PCC 7107]|uniref:PEP-CTERM sorting domain-containing protein n=1 Tax=Nostoc sp. PCC 7107 TaxID=317936 RepID=UPI00029EDE7C|nr:PEP-CTERM sorting domain-containing protein [Nostoc sp. PCC 7107]AFY45472.1 PEP motif putative anchor domain protein [Nostoc sp. PCC 7107]